MVKLSVILSFLPQANYCVGVGEGSEVGEGDEVEVGDGDTVGEGDGDTVGEGDGDTVGEGDSVGEGKKSGEDGAGEGEELAGVEKLEKG